MPKQKKTPIPRRTKPRLKFEVYEQPALILLFFYTCGQLHQNTLNPEVFVQESLAGFFKSCPKGTFL